MNLITNHLGGFLGTGVSFADFNDDGFDDLSFGHHTGELKFFIGNGEGFEEIDLGISNGEAESKGIVWLDIDNDHDLDLIVTNRLSSNRMWENVNGVMVDISNSCGISLSMSTRSYGISVGDYNNDGFVDLYICNYHTWIDAVENELYMNNGDGTFTETTAIAGVGNNFQQSFQSTFIDINHDGWLDLHVINDRVEMYNAFYINNGDGTFTDMAQSLGLDLGLYAMSSSFGDMDGDGDMDLYVTNGYDGNVLLENHLFDPMEAFSDVTMSYGVGEYELCWAADWIDYDNDSENDLYVASGITVYSDYPAINETFPQVTNSLYVNDGIAPFSNGYADVPDWPQHTFAVAQGDYNNDGSPDLVSHRLGIYASMLRGTPTNNKWAKIKLEGTETNSMGIGARIEVSYYDNFGTSKEKVDHVIAGENYLGQNSFWQHFGLENASHIESITVHWIGGETEVFDGPYEVNQHIILTEGDSSGEANSDSVVEGCTYPGACNYDAEATYDTGSCDFECLCGEGTVWDVDSGTCVGYDDCPTDLNNNGATEVGDLLMILSFHGSSCSE